jgi:hypothetical protein
MADDTSKTRRTLALGLSAAAASSLIPASAWAQRDDTYSEPEIIRAASDFFGAAAEGLSNVIHHIFNDKGRPNGYITGEEGSGAIGIGLRYGGGRLHLKTRSGVTPVYWQGPSVGFDTGGNASKVFTSVSPVSMARPISSAASAPTTSRAGASSWRRSAPASVSASAPMSAT